ncbi:hypothetical protein PTTG_28526, partial [Puccinia triticina 1-1 BBBD Race 1]
MVRTRSRNPEIIIPDFAARVTPPRSAAPSPASSVSTFHSVEGHLSMSDDEASTASLVPGSFPSDFTFRPVSSAPVNPAMRSSFRPSVRSLVNPPPPNESLANESAVKPGPSDKGKGRDVPEVSPSPAPRSSVKPDLTELSGDGLLRRVLGPDGFDGLNEEVLKVLLVKALSEPPKANTVTSSSVSSHLHWQKAGEKLSPSLLLDGSNFPLWSASLKELVATVTRMENYFDRDMFEDDSETALGVLTVIKHSIDPALRSSLNGMTAHGAWMSLVGRFAGASWSVLATRWADIARSLDDASDSVASTFETFKRGLIDLETRLGGWTTDNLLALTFHSALRRHGSDVANAMDARLAI